MAKCNQLTSLCFKGLVHRVSRPLGRCSAVALWRLMLAGGTQLWSWWSRRDVALGLRWWRCATS